MPGRIRVRIVGNLVKILAQRCDDAKLIAGIGVENQGRKSSVAVLRIVKNLADRGLKSVVAAIPIEARVVGKSLGVPAEVDLIVRLKPVAETGDEFRFIIPLEAGAGDDIKDSVSPVSVISFVAASLHLQIINVLGINCRAQIARDIRVGNG